MDPIIFLRSYISRGQVERISRLLVSLDEFLFRDEYCFPYPIETSYKHKQGGFYTLESLLFIKKSHLKHIDYLQQARAQRLQIISLPNWKPLLDYIQGKINSTDTIQPVLKPAVKEYCPEDPILFNKRLRAEADGNGSLGNQNNAENHRGINWIMLTRVLEKPLKDREALLECRNKNFQHVIVIANKREEKKMGLKKKIHRNPIGAPSDPSKKKGFGKDLGAKFSMQKDGLKGNSRQSLAVNTDIISNSRSVAEGVPIIVVPSAFQTLLNMYNVKEFLEDGVYYALDAKVKQMPKNPECITMHRKSVHDRTGFTIEVRDKPSSLSLNEWTRRCSVCAWEGMAVQGLSFQGPC